MIKDKIAEVLDITPKPRQNILVPVEAKDTLDDDTKSAKQNIRDLIEAGRDALMDAIEVAKDSESPRAYEVVANLLKQLADMNQQLIELYGIAERAKPQEQQSPNTPSSMTQVNNPTIFVGTSTDLSKALAQFSNKGTQ